MAQVSFRKVRKEYGSQVAVAGIDLEIDAGEFVVLVGPSGCGKSTLLRLVAGLEEMTSGKLVINGKVYNHLEPQDRDVAMVFQSYALFPHLTVEKNIGYGLRVRKGKTDSEIKHKVMETALLLGLDKLLDRQPAQLSGGQRQRVAMSRAMIRNPQLFLFDEPLSNLDAQLRTQLRLEIKRIHRRLRKTTIYVTHDQIEAMTLADRIVVLRDGNVEQIGDSLEIYDRPVNLFVGLFIGTPEMNTIKLRRENGKLILLGGDDASAFTVVATNGNRSSLVSLLEQSGINMPREMVLGVRPEALSVRSGSGGAFKIRLDLIERTGSETYCYYDGAGTTLCSATKERVRENSGVMNAELIGSGLHLFSADSGKRLDLDFSL